MESKRVSWKPGDEGASAKLKPDQSCSCCHAARWGGHRRWTGLRHKAVQGHKSHEATQQEPHLQAWQLDHSLADITTPTPSVQKDIESEYIAAAGGMAWAAMTAIYFIWKLCMRKAKPTSSVKHVYKNADYTEDNAGKPVAGYSSQLEAKQAYMGQYVENMPMKRLCQVRGDGNCMWRSLGKLMQAPWRMVKQHTLTHARAHGASRAVMRRYSKSGCWGNAYLLHLAALAWDCNIVVQTPDQGNWQIATGSLTTYHMKLERYHYTPLVIADDEEQHYPVGIHQLTEGQIPCLEGGSTTARALSNVGLPEESWGDGHRVQIYVKAINPGGLVSPENWLVTHDRQTIRGLRQRLADAWHIEVDRIELQSPEERDSFLPDNVPLFRFDFEAWIIPLAEMDLPRGPDWRIIRLCPGAPEYTIAAILQHDNGNPDYEALELQHSGPHWDSIRVFLSARLGVDSTSLVVARIDAPVARLYGVPRLLFATYVPEPEEVADGQPSSDDSPVSLDHYHEQDHLGIEWLYVRLDEFSEHLNVTFRILLHHDQDSDPEFEAIAILGDVPSQARLYEWLSYRLVCPPNMLVIFEIDERATARFDRRRMWMATFLPYIPYLRGGAEGRCMSKQAAESLNADDEMLNLTQVGPEHESEPLSHPIGESVVGLVPGKCRTQGSDVHTCSPTVPYMPDAVCEGVREARHSESRDAPPPTTSVHHVEHLCHVQCVDGNYLSQDQPFTWIVTFPAGSVYVIVPKHWSKSDILQVLSVRGDTTLTEDVSLSCSDTCPNWSRHCCRLHILQHDSIRSSSLWSAVYANHPDLQGGGKGAGEGDSVGQALGHLRKFGALSLAPQHARILLQAKPSLVQSVLATEDPNALRGLISKQANKAHLPLQVDAQKSTPVARGSSVPPVRKDGSAANRSRSLPTKGKGGRNVSDQKSPDDPVPILFQVDWDVPIVQDLWPGQQGVTVASSMSQVQSLLTRWKGAQGKACIVALDKSSFPDVRQKQCMVNLGLKQGIGFVVKPTLAWIIQVGDSEVMPKNVAPTISIAPRHDSSIVTAVVAYKDSVTKALQKEIQDKKAMAIKAHLASVLPNDLAHRLDAFKFREDDDSWFCLVRFPTTALQDILRTSGLDGVFLRSPREHESQFGLLWLQGDLSTDADLARKSLEKLPEHLGLVRGKKGLGYRVPRDRLAAARQAQGQDPNPMFLVEGLPPEAVPEDIEEMLKKCSWEAKVIEDSRRMSRGGAVWKVRAPNAPPTNAVQLAFGEQQCVVHIRELGVSAAIPGPKPQRVIEVKPPKSWAEAVEPRVFRTTEAKETTSASASSSHPAPAAAFHPEAALHSGEGKKRRVDFVEDGKAPDATSEFQQLFQKVQQQDQMLRSLMDAIQMLTQQQAQQNAQIQHAQASANMQGPLGAFDARWGSGQSQPPTPPLPQTPQASDLPASQDAAIEVDSGDDELAQVGAS